MRTDIQIEIKYQGQELLVSADYEYDAEDRVYDVTALSIADMEGVLLDRVPELYAYALTRVQDYLIDRHNSPEDSI